MAWYSTLGQGYPVCILRRWPYGILAVLVVKLSTITWVGDRPRFRRRHQIGDDNIHAAADGVEAAIHRRSMPSARSRSTLNANVSRTVNRLGTFGYGRRVAVTFEADANRNSRMIAFPDSPLGELQLFACHRSTRNLKSTQAKMPVSDT